MGGEYSYTPEFITCMAQTNAAGQTLLYVACRFSKSETINKILNCIEINWQTIINERSSPGTHNSTAAIGLATSLNKSLSEKIELLKLLMSKGADLKLENNYNENIYDELVKIINNVDLKVFPTIKQVKMTIIS
jgi:hypothetical protein